LGLKN